MSALAVVGLTAVLAVIGTWASERVAHRWGAVAVPGPRSSHSRPTPKVGGLGLLVAAAVGVVLLAAAPVEGGFVAYAVGAVLLAALSLVNDLRDLPSRLRLLVHVGLATAVAAAGVGAEEVRLVGSDTLPVALGFPLAALWIVAWINFYNFMDGIDGIAASHAILAGGWFAWTLWGSAWGALNLAIAAAALGFLVRNWPPARVFMGDVGSCVLGFTFAVSSIRASASPFDVPLVASLLVLWLFAFDTTYTLVRRLRRGESISQAHRSHLYQRASRTLGGHRPVTLAMLGLHLALLAAAVAYRGASTIGRIALLAVAWLGGWALVRLVNRVERRRRRDGASGVNPANSA